MSEQSHTLFCSNHPKIETTLRCNRCEKPICPKCAILTPTGYRCKECVRGQQKVFNTAEWYDYPLAIGVSAILAFLGSQIASSLGFIILFVAPIAGVIISEVTRFVIRRRRSRRLFQIITLAVALGCLPSLLIQILIFLGGAGALFPLVWQGLYTFMVTSTVYYRLAGISIVK